MQGWRKSMEDEHICEINILNEASIFGVFDGHGGYANSGREVAIFVKRHIKEELISLQSFQNEDYRLALIECFLNLDKRLESPAGRLEIKEIESSITEKSLLFASTSTENKANYVGCTACVALITKNKIYVANAGDSRCVLCVNGKSVELSKDHKPDHPDERTRINKAKGYVENNRINGVLNLSRSIGDLEFKKNKDFKQSEQIVTSYPDIREHSIGFDADFLIIACDGIWDCLTSQSACDKFKERITSISKSKEKNLKNTNIVSEILDNILAKNVTTSGGIGCDNMTCILVVFTKPN